MKLARVVLPLVLVAALAGCGVSSEEEAVPTVTETVTATPTPTPSATPTPSPTATPTPSEPAPTSAAVDRTAEVQAIAGAGVTRAEQDETGRFTIWTAIVDPRGDDGSPEAQAAIAICNAVQQSFGASSISVYEADESTFVVYGHPVYGPNSCAEV